MARWLHALPVALVLAVAGCGGDDGGGTEVAPPEPAPAGRPADFPSAEGKTLDGLTGELADIGPQFAPSTSQLEVGTNRFGFVLFDNARKQLRADAVALYAARPDGSGLRGPFIARPESIAVEPQYRSRQTAADLASGDTFYVAEVPVRRRGDQVLTAVARLDGRLVGTSLFEAQVGRRGGPPEVGDRAPRVHTETVASARGDLSKLSTRVPPIRAMHEKDFYDVLGKEPAVLVFATPQLCASRVCGPVVDIAEEVRARVGQGVTFIHQEVFIDNNPKRGYRAPLVRFGLLTEPWIFVVDRRGRIAARFEGALSVGELARAVEKVKR